MIKFSELNQSFYDDSLVYEELPNDLIEVTGEQHYFFLDKINSGCKVFSDLTFSEPKPSQFHTWTGSSWADNRDQDEIDAYNRSVMPGITKRQFWLTMYDHGMKNQIESLLAADERAKIEFDSVDSIERLSPTVIAMSSALGLMVERVDELWTYAMTL